MKKNELYEVTIEDISTDGEGIGHIFLEEAVQTGREEKGIAVFVKDTVMGDVIQVRITKVKKNYVYGRMEKLITPSPYRVEPRCGKARSCGGCTLMHMSYEKQLDYKWNSVKNCLQRIGGIDAPEQFMEPIDGMEYPYEFRNKMQFPVGCNKEGRVEIGFYAGHTHSIVDLPSCEIGHPINNYILNEIRPWLQKWQDLTGSFIYDEEAHKGLVRHILIRTGFTTGEVMVCLVVNGEGLPDKNKDIDLDAGTHRRKKHDVSNDRELGNSCVDELYALLKKAIQAYSETRSDCINGDRQGKQTYDVEYKLCSLVLNINQDKTNRILGDRCKVLWGNLYITDYIGTVKFRISPMSFYQVNPVQTKVLYDKAVGYAELTGEEIVWDLYCGIGTISLSLAEQAKKVYGVEIVPQAIEDAKQNAAINGTTNVEFFCGKAEEVVPEFYERNRKKDGEVIWESEAIKSSAVSPDIIVVDPPRKGCEEVLLDTIVQMAPKKIVYVSCNPATLARDLKILMENGYDLKKIGVVDQFCHSTHVETVVLLTRQNT